MRGQSWRLKPWPFAADEVVTLAWLRSPQMTGPQDQWRSVASFRPQSGMPETLELDWAMLPLLRLGQRYRDGRPISGDFEAPLDSLDLSGAAPPKLVAARSVLSSSVYRLYKSENWRELCWVWTLPGPREIKVVVPVLVLLQGLFAGGSLLAQGLLDPLFLDRLRHEVDGTTLRLHFAASFALPVRSRERDALLILLARLLNDDSFRAAFRSVSLGRWSEPTGPLQCELPELRAVWEARVLSRGNVQLVQELVQAEPAEALGLDRVTYQHPLYPKREVQLPKPKTTRLVRTPRSLIVNTQTPAARSARVRSEVPAPNATLVESKRPVIENVGKLETEDTRSSVQPWKGGGEREVSFSGTGQNASAPQASVRPGRADEPPPRSEDLDWSAVEQWNEPQEDGLNDFREMLAELCREHPEVEIEFRLGPQQIAGSERIFNRPYAVVSLAAPDKPLVWLVEFAKRLSRPMSTLLLSATGETWQEFEVLLREVLSKGLDLKYWWNLGALTLIAVEADVDIERMRHSNWGSKQWAERIFNNLKD